MIKKERNDKILHQSAIPCIDFMYSKYGIFYRKMSSPVEIMGCIISSKKFWAEHRARIPYAEL